MSDPRADTEPRQTDTDERAGFEMVSGGVAVHRRPLAARLATWAIGSWVSMCPLMAVGMLALRPGSPALAAFGVGLLGLLFAGSGFSLAAIALALVGRRRAARLEVRGDALHLRDGRGRERTIALAAVRDAVLMPGRDAARARVEVRLRGARTLSVDVDGTAQGDELLAALGHDAARRRATVAPRGRGLAIIMGFGAGFVTYLSTFFALLAAGFGRGHAAGDGDAAILSMALGALTGMIVAAWRQTPRITVGADGVLIDYFVRRRFVPLAEVTSAVGVPSALSLHRPDGSIETIAIRGANGAQLAAVAHRINEALEARAREAGQVFEPAALARGGRALPEWRAALARLLEAPAGFRQMAIDRTALVRLLEDARASVEQRLAAALALTARGHDGEARERVRAVAESVADERVRVALERVAEGSVDEADVERALEAQRASE